MIKIIASLTGEVFKEAKSFKTKDGKEVSTISIKTLVKCQDKSLGERQVIISASKEGENTDLYAFKPGDRIKAKGIISVRKKEGRLFLNLTLEEISSTDSIEDKISGEMEFRGIVGKEVKENFDKNNRPFVAFSAYSSYIKDKERQYVWVHFIRFDAKREKFLAPKAKVQILGFAEIKYYKETLDLHCRVSKIKPWQPKLSGDDSSIEQEEEIEGLEF